MGKSKDRKYAQKPLTLRVRVPSAKAKAAKETPAKQQQSSSKKSTQKTKARTKEMVKGGSEEDEPMKGSDDERNEDDGPKVDWKDVDLNWALITALEEDLVIRQGLFPLPGKNTTVIQGGSKPKTDYQWALAEKIFGDHEKYRDAFSQVKLPAERSGWALKIKNRLKRMMTDVRKYRDEMGQTGAGITCEEDIDMTLNNTFTNRWAQIKEKCPWYWHLNAIIGERPNAVPAGIGNNSSSYDTSILLDPNAPDINAASSGVSDIQGDGSLHETNPSDGIESDESALVLSSSDSEDDVKRDQKIAGKRKAEEAMDRKAVGGKKSVAKSGKSMPVPAQLLSKRKKTGIEKLEALATKEEETTQKVLELKKAKMKGTTERVLAKIKASADVKMQREKIRADLAARKLDHDFQLRLAQINANRAQHPNSLGTHTNAASGSPIVMSGTGWSDVGSATPSTYSETNDNSNFVNPFSFSNTQYLLPPAND